MRRTAAPTRTRWFDLAWAILVALSFGASSSTPEASGTPRVRQTQSTAPQSLAPYVPTPQEVVDRMLELAEVTANDVVLDLGCGDGRIPITAAVKYGARGIGVDIDPIRVAESRANAIRAGVEHLVEFREQDALQVDASKVTVVTLYLLSSSNLKLRPILTRQLAPGSRIVSHAFSMGDWEAETVDRFTDANGNTRTLYLWHTDGTVRP